MGTAINVAPGQHHECCAAGERGSRIPSSAIGIVATNGVPNQNRRGRADPKRHGERESGKIERNLMSRELFGPEPAHQQSDKRKRAVFNLQMNTDRTSEREHAPERPQLESAKFKEANAPPQTRPTSSKDRQRHEPTAERRRPSRTANATGRKSEVPKD